MIRRFFATSLLAVPAVVLVLIVALGLLRVNGSSIALHDESPSSPELIGQPRQARSDEFAVRTPLVVRQERLDFPTETEMGIGVHDTGVLSDLPVKSISSIIKPHSWPYFVLDLERAFAIEWWLVVFGPLLGVYAVLAIITRSRLLSTLAGLIAAAAPAAAWWEIPSMGLTTLYGGLTAALLIATVRRTGRRRLLMAAAAGWAAAAFASLLYIPWIIPLTIIFGAIVLSQLPGTIRGWRPWLMVAGVFGGVFVILMAIFYEQHHVALRAIADSVYPGDRVTKGGEARPALFFSAPFDVFTTTRPVVDVDGTNQSESASGLMLWIPIALVGGAFSGLRSRLATARALAATMLAALVLGAWALMPVPARLGSIVGLTRVQGFRLAWPLTVAGALAAGLYVHRVRVDGGFRPERNRALIATVAFSYIIGWAGTLVMIDGRAPSRGAVTALWIAATLVTFAVVSGKAMLGLGGACLLLLFGSVRVNPLQVGLGPITNDPLLGQIDEVRGSDPGGRWAVLDLDLHAGSILMASGAPTATGISWYNDDKAWQAIDPTNIHQFERDRFELVAIVIDEGLTAVQFELRQADYLIIYTPPCNGALQQLEVRYVVLPAAAGPACFDLVASPQTGGERWIYEVASAGS